MHTSVYPYKSSCPAWLQQMHGNNRACWGEKKGEARSTFGEKQPIFTVQWLIM